MSDKGGLKLAARRTIRFVRGVASPDVDAFDHTTPTSDSELQQLTELTEGVRYTRLFSPLEPNQIDDLVRLAQERDQSYTPPNFHAYYFADTKDGEGWDEHDKAFDSGDFKALIDVARVLLPGGPPTTEPSPHNLVHAAWHFQDAPSGTDAEFAWAFPGGEGEGVRLADIELVQPLDHPQLPMDRITKFGGSSAVTAGKEDHATAVLGVFLGGDAQSGTFGAVPSLDEAIVVSNIVDGRVNTAAAIMLAASKLERGDVLLIEHQDKDKVSHLSVPAEFDEAVYQAVRLATALGIVVVEVGGNGSEGNDEPELRAVEFDSVKFEDGSRFIRGAGGRDSLAIVVSAVQFDPGSGKYKRIGWAPFGQRVDCHARGEGVLTCRCDVNVNEQNPVADLLGEPGQDVTITPRVVATFGGTSAAAAIIAATAVQIQGIVKNGGHEPLWPEQMREILGNELWGTRPLPDPDRPIGTMPNLKLILEAKARGEFPALPPHRKQQPS